MVNSLSLPELEQENLMAGEKLVQTYEQAEELLNQVRQALRIISLLYSTSPLPLFSPFSFSFLLSPFSFISLINEKYQKTQ
jgi:hypothetical protein